MKKFFALNRNDYALIQEYNIHAFQCIHNVSSIIRSYDRSIVKTVECKK